MGLMTKGNLLLFIKGLIQGICTYASYQSSATLQLLSKADPVGYTVD